MRNQNKLKAFSKIALKLLESAYNNYSDLEIIRTNTRVDNYPADLQLFADVLFNLDENSFAMKYISLVKARLEFTNIITAFDSEEIDFYVHNTINRFHDLRLQLALDDLLFNMLTEFKSSSEGLLNLHTAKERIDDLLKSAESVVPKDVNFSELVVKSIERYEDEIANDKPRLTCSFAPTLNNRLNGGFSTRGEYVGILGPYKSMKTTFALSLAYNYAKKSLPTAFFSLEMGEEKFMNLANAVAAKIPFNHVNNPKQLRDEDKQKLAVLSTKDVPFFPVFDCMTEKEIIHKAKLLSKKHGVNNIFIDYYQKIRTRGKFDSEERRLTYISDRFMELMRDTGINVFMVSQVNREGLRNAPTYENAAGSLALAKDCTTGLIMYSPYRINEKLVNTDEGKHEFTENMYALLVDISRTNEQNKNVIPLAYDKETSQLHEITQDLPI